MHTTTITNTQLIFSYSMFICMCIINILKSSVITGLDVSGCSFYDWTHANHIIKSPSVQKTKLVAWTCCITQ